MVEVTMGRRIWKAKGDSLYLEKCVMENNKFFIVSGVLFCMTLFSACTAYIFKMLSICDEYKQIWSYTKIHV